MVLGTPVSPCHLPHHAPPAGTLWDPCIAPIFSTLAFALIGVFIVLAISLEAKARHGGGGGGGHGTTPAKSAAGHSSTKL